MNGADDAGTSNTVSGGTVQNLLQGRDFRNITFNTVQAAAAPVALAQLPAPVAGFTGRDAELAEVTGLLDPAAGAGAVVVSAVAGLAGVGKTALAIQAAHTARAAGWFPGGVLFLDLHGYDEQAVQPAQALDALLRALGIPAEHIPPGAEERAGLYRSALAQITDPVLVVADNASAEAQVRPLLPGPGPHRVLVTSRHTLAGLGARLLDVEVLAEQAAITLVEEVLRAARPGDDRISRDRGAAGRLAGVCGGLPLALRITAALLAADPALTAAELAGQLRDEVGRLGALRYDDGGGTSAPSVAAAFDLSYRHLDEPRPRGCSGCWRSIQAQRCPRRQPRRWPGNPPVRRGWFWGGWYGRIWWNRPGPGRAGGGCMTCWPCTPARSPAPIPVRRSGSRRGTGCWTTTSRAHARRIIICGRGRACPYRRGLRAGPRRWRGWTANGPA